MKYNYTFYDFKKDMTGIPSIVTDYLVERLSKDEYRGTHISQHNRYDRILIFNILNELNNTINLLKIDKLIIRNTDTKKRPKNTLDEYDYAKMVERLSIKFGKPTQDSLRKNFFLDMARMGLIHRFNKKGIKDNTMSKVFRTKSVAVSKLGHEFLKAFNSSNIFEMNRFWTLSLNNLHRGFENKLFNLMILISEKLKKNITLSLNEYAFFATDKYYTNEYMADIIIAFKNLSIYQRGKIVSIIKKYANPNSNLFFKIDGKNKTDARDYHNWINEAQQMFPLLKDTILFGIGDIRSGELNIRFSNNGGILTKSRIKRSISEKKAYFINHELNQESLKKSGYELHHIVPLLMAKNNEEFAILDNWKNMILIDAFTHAQISTRGSKHIKLNFINKDIELSDTSTPPDTIKCIYDTNVKYNIKQQIIMQKTNDDILKSI